jgi:dTDP-4-dehydrorhamnose reductase
MLGQTVNAYLKAQGHDVFATSRKHISTNESSNLIKFDAISDEVKTLELKKNNYDFIINCIGIIRHQITDSRESKVNAIHVNSLFPIKLIEALEGSTTKVIQIGTDCVFSGSTGAYSEGSEKDPIDYYGFSKAMGEISSENQMLLRCSIIGRENDNFLSLMEWLLRQPLKSVLNGFIDHKWNGLTTLAFSKILDGVISHDSFEPGSFHVVPKDQVTKFQLLQLLASTFDRNDLQILPTNSATPIDRTLTTTHVRQNTRFWEHADYPQIPRIEDMLTEYESYTRNLPSK